MCAAQASLKMAWFQRWKPANLGDKLLTTFAVMGTGVMGASTVIRVHNFFVSVEEMEQKVQNLEQRLGYLESDMDGRLKKLASKLDS